MHVECFRNYQNNVTAGLKSGAGVAYALDAAMELAAGVASTMKDYRPDGVLGPDFGEDVRGFVSQEVSRTLSAFVDEFARQIRPTEPGPGEETEPS